MSLCLGFIVTNSVQETQSVSAQTLTIKFNSNGGTAVANKYVSNGSKLGTLPTNPTRSGYVFNGWRRSDNNAWVNANTVMTGSAGIKYTVKSGDYPVKILDVYQKKGVLSSDFNTAKATFLAANGWTAWPSLSVGQVIYITPDKLTITLNAQWLPAFTVYYNGNGGTPSTSQKVIGSGQAIGALATASRTGYTHTGWYTARSGGTKITTSTTFNVTSQKTYTVKSGDWLSKIAKNNGISLNNLLAWNGLTANSVIHPGNVLKVSDPALVKKSDTIYAQWSINSYKIIFDSNGGTATNPTTKTVQYGAALPAFPASPTRSGYTFQGWGWNKTEVARNFNAYRMEPRDIRVYAVWKANNYTISWNSNGGTAVSSWTKAYDSTLGTLPAPTRSGYSLNGWYTSATGGTKISTSTKVTGNKTYYAQWSATTRTVKFDGNGGTVSPTSKVVNYNAEVGTLPSGSRTHYTLKGFYTTKTGTTQITAKTKVTSNVTYYAQWTPINYTVILNGNGGSSTSKVVKYNTEFGALPSSSRTGYSFVGWFNTTNATGGTQLLPTTKITGNVTYYARWKANNYKILWVSQGGSAVFVWSRDYGTSLGTLPTISRTGYSFNGWYTSATGGTKISTSTKVTSDVTYYARWTPINYTITWNSQGGTAVDKWTRAYGTSLGTLPAPTRTHYYLNGWYTSSTGGTKISTSTTVSGNVTYYAQWVGRSYTFTFDANGGGTPSSTSITRAYNTNIGTLPTVSRTGYTFKGWWTTSAASGGTQLTTTTKVTSNVTYYARWTNNNYTITWNKNGGNEPSFATTTKTYNSTIGTLPSISRTGYTFRGWFDTTASSGGNQAQTSTKITGNKTYYARWTINSYTVIWNANGGTAVSNTKHNYNTTVGTLPSTTRSGYTFKGWFTASSGGSQVTTSTKITGNVTFVAQWTGVPRTVTFSPNGGGTPSQATKTIANGSKLGTLPTISRTGYTFRGWWTTSAATGGTQATTTTVITGNTVYYARWTVNNQTIKWDSQGGSAVGSWTRAYGTSLGTLPTTTRSHYRFNGWFTSSSGGTKISTSTKVTGNLTYYAQWTINSYTATFNANGGNTPSPTTITRNYGVALGTLPTVTRSNYDFTGWFTSASGGTKISTSTTLSGNVTYYAQWVGTPRTITFNANGGTPATTTKTIAHYSALGTLPTVTRTNYTLVGWYTSATGGTKISASTTVSGNATYYARWTGNPRTVTFNGNGGTPSEPSQVVNHGDAIGTLPTATRTHYNFTGWFTAASGGTKISTSTKVTANVTYYAQWTPVNYTVTFNSNGGNAATPATKSIAYLSTIGKLPTATRTGYTLKGWFTNTSSGTQITESTVVKGNVTYYAQWTPIKYTITFNANGGSAVSSRTLDYDSILGTLPNTTRAGYDFKGWYTATSGGSQVYPHTIVKGTATYYARWEIKTYDVKFSEQGGIAVSDRRVQYNQSVGELPITTRTGHTFNGWFTAISNGTKVTADTKITGNTTFYAQWTINTYTVTFNSQGGPAVPSVQVTYNFPVGKLPAPTRVEYDLVGWYTTIVGGTKITSDTRITNNVTFYARWKLKEYPITWNSQGGTAVANTIAQYNVPFGKLPAPTRLGYDLVGWFTQTGGKGTRVTEQTAVTSAQTYYAHWVIRGWEEADFLYGEGATAITGLSSSGQVKKDAGVPLVFPTLPNVVKISDNAFAGAGFTGTIDMKGLANLKTIGANSFKSNAFTGALNLSALTKLETIGNEAFLYNNFNGAITFPSTNNIKTIGARAFSGNASSGVQNNFSGTLNLGALTKLETIGDEAFSNNKFTGALTLGTIANVKTIGNSAFEGNGFTGALTLKRLVNLESIGNRAFYGNKFKGALDITALAKLHTIGQDAFSTIAGNSKISSVTDTAPTGKKRIWVTTKGNYNTEVKLADIAARPSVPVYAEWFNLVWEADDFTYTNNTTRTVITGLSERGAKKRELGLKGLVFPNITTVTSIADNAFSGKAFEGTLDLRQLKNLDTIGVEAFANNKFTGNLNFAGLSKLKTIKNGAFNKAYNTSSTIGTLTIKSLTALTTIEANAFTGNKFTGGLDLTGNTNLVTIGANAFKGVIHNPSNTAAPINISGLAKLQTIGAGAFSDNNSQTTLSLSGLTALVTIGEGAFRNANITGSLSLNALTNLVEIQDNAFRGNKFSGNLTFGSISKLTRIGADAFNDGTPTGSTGFTGIIDISNVASLNEIGANAFYGHNQVTDFIDYIKSGKQRSWFTQPNGAGNRVTQANIPNGPSSTIYGQLEDLFWEIQDFTYADSGKTITGLSSRGVQKLGAGLKGLTFPGNNNITAIANNAFNGSKYKFNGSLNLNGIPNVKTIGDNAFANAQFTGNLTLNALQGLTKIGNGAFTTNQFTGGLNLNLPNLTAIGDNAFSNNQLNGSLSLGGVPNLQTIGASAFRHNKFSGTLDLKALVKIDSVGAYAFANNTGFTIVVEPEIPRYRFHGWFTGRNGTGSKQDIRTNTSTVYAHQVAIVYYHLTLKNDMTDQEIARIEYEENTEIDLLNDPNIPTPVLDGYRFVGWQSEDDFETTRTKIVLDKDKTITTKWVPIGYYIIQFVVNGGIEIADIEVRAGESVLLGDLTERQGFILEGWYLDEALTKKAFTEFTPDRDTTLYAKWIPRDTNIVKFDSNGGNKVVDISVLEGYQVGDLPVPKRQGYIFLGWYLNKNYTTEITSTFVPTNKETILYANWTAMEDVVRATFDSGEGVDNFVYVRERGTSLGTLPRPLRDGLYNFEGWYTQEGGKGTKINSNTIVNNNITYYANWLEVKVNDKGKDYEDKDNLYNPGAVPKPEVTVEDIINRIDEFNQEDSEPVSRITTVDNVASEHWRVGNSVQDTLVIEDNTDPSNPRQALYGDEGYE